MSIALALLLSAALTGGLTLLVLAAPPARRPSLAARLDPYLRGLEPSRTKLLGQADTSLTAFPAAERLLRPLLEEGARLVERWLGGSARASVRLRAAGRDPRLSRYRAEQVLWGLAGFTAAVVAAIVLPELRGRTVTPVLLLAAATAGVLAGVLGRDWWLAQEVERRQARLLRQFPALVDLLCLAVTAGESPRAALERVVRAGRGEMTRELAVVLADVRLGTPFTVAMERLAARVPMPAIARFVDGLVVAVERGTPLADVLHAQAADVREQHKRRLIEAGGRKEVYMLVPVVFLILPVVVLFALYPGIYALSVLAR